MIRSNKIGWINTLGPPIIVQVATIPLAIRDIYELNTP